MNTRTDEKLQKLSELLSKYERNKTGIPKEELEGKYKVAFLKLKTDLAEAASEYGKARLIDAFPSGIDSVTIQKDKVDTLAKMVNDYIKRSGLCKKISILLFRHFDLQGVISATEEAQGMVKGIYEKFKRQYPGAIIPYVMLKQGENVEKVVKKATKQ